MYGVFHVCIAMAALGYLNKTLNKFPLLSSCQVSTLYVFTQVSHKSCSWSLLVSNMEEWELWERIWFDFESRTRRTCSLIPIGTFSLQEVDVSTIMHGNRKSRDLILESRIIKLFLWRSLSLMTFVVWHADVRTRSKTNNWLLVLLCDVRDAKILLARGP